MYDSKFGLIILLPFVGFRRLSPPPPPTVYDAYCGPIVYDACVRIICCLKCTVGCYPNGALTLTAKTGLMHQLGQELGPLSFVGSDPPPPAKWPSARFYCRGWHDAWVDCRLKPLTTSPCPFFGPFPSVSSGAHWPLTTYCPSSPSLAHLYIFPSLYTLPFPW